MSSPEILFQRSPGETAIRERQHNIRAHRQRPRCTAVQENVR